MVFGVKVSKDNYIYTYAGHRCPVSPHSNVYSSF